MDVTPDDIQANATRTWTRVLGSVALCVLIVLGGVGSARADNVRLSVSSTGLGAALELVPAGRLVACGDTRCLYEFARGTTVYVSARPKAPSSFARWLGACTDASSTCAVALDRNTSLTARFTPVALYLQAPSKYEGVVSFRPRPVSSCGPSCLAYRYATPVTVQAEAAAPYVFRSWSGSACGPVAGTVCSFTLFKDSDVMPRFTCAAAGEDACVGQVASPLEREVLTTINVIGAGSRASVMINGTRCARRTCALPIERGRVVSLRADAGGLRFKGFSGSCTSASLSCQLTAFRDARGRLPRITATFR